MADNDQGQGGSDDGVVTSAPASGVGSLLTDLLNEAKKEVAKERENLEQQINTREAEERTAREREEAKKRDALQKQLIEETRRRNEALTRKERAEAAARAAAQAAAQPKPVVEVPIAEPAPVPQKSKLGLVVGLIVAVLVVGGGGAVAFIVLNRTEPIVLPDIRAEAKLAVAEASRALHGQLSERDKDKLKARMSALEQRAASEAAARVKAEKKAKDATQEAEHAKKVAEEAAKAAKNGAGKKKKGGGGKKSSGGTKLNYKGAFKP